MQQANVPVGGAYYQGQPIAGAWGSTGAPAPTDTSAAAPSAFTLPQSSSTPAKAAGGMTRDGKFIVGDSRSGRPTGYEELIVNPTNAPIRVVPNSEIARYYGGTMTPRYADGTADNPTGSVFGTEMQDTTAARNFLAQAVQRALSGTPWTTTNLPTSVYASTPGMDPAVQELLASINAQARGVPASTFLRQASLYAPSGFNQGVTRRTG